MMATTSFTLQTTFKRAPQQAFCDVHGEVVILDADKGEYYSLEEVGARIWHLLQEPRTVGEIRDTILAEYEVSPARCEQDLRAFLQSLIAKGLVERDEPGEEANSINSESRRLASEA